MNRKELVYREIASSHLDGKTTFTQLELSKKLSVSLSIINSAVTSLKDINAVKVKQRSFEVVSLERLLLYWATHRNLRKDIVYQTRADMPVKEIEVRMPNGIAFTGYSAYRFLFDEAPADYSEVYVYATPTSLNEIKRRFEPNDKIPNLIVLGCDAVLEEEIKSDALQKSSVRKAQLFADLWNMNQWYAKDFVDALSKKLGL